ncbi:MAG TPA: ATP-dependent Clp protease proteolytic subunit, partial [Spirochaetia bacterium]|nr:ATP-dependent Clp protease proteolytic subunit [Spirochaetia bacterium]
ESIINAYEIKTGQSRAKLSHLMDAETWLNANKAIELGFADGILEDEKKRVQSDDVTYAFSRRAVTNSLLSKVKPKIPKQNKGTPIESLEKRLSLISH